MSKAIVVLCGKPINNNFNNFGKGGHPTTYKAFNKGNAGRGHFPTCNQGIWSY
jgi:uncharacterized protein YycO